MFIVYLFKEIIMNVQWSKLVFKIAVWLSFEIFLTTLGLDDLADYSEFVFQYKAFGYIAETSTDIGFAI